VNRNLLNTTVSLEEVREENNQIYYKLIIGTDPVTRLVITEDNIEALLKDLPRIFSTIIHTHVLIEKSQIKEEVHS